MHSDKNRGARTEPWRGVRVKEKAKEKKPTTSPKKTKRIRREVKRKWYHGIQEGIELWEGGS